MPAGQITEKRINLSKLDSIYEEVSYYFIVNSKRNMTMFIWDYFPSLSPEFMVHGCVRGIVCVHVCVRACMCVYVCACVYVRV